MLIRTIVVAAPLLLGAGQGSGESQDSSKGKQEQPSGSQMGDSVEGHGHSAGALGNSSDTTGAKGKGGAGTNAGTAGAREDQTGSGEKGDTTSGAKGAGSSAGASGAPGPGDRSAHGHAQEGASGAPAPGDRSAHGHAQDKTLSGKLSDVSGDSVTIESAKGEKHELKVAPQTRFTLGGKDVKPGQLSEGQEVRASYMEQGGDRIAVQIQASGGAEPDREKTHNPRNNPQTEGKK